MPAAKKKGKILIVDDDQELVRLMSELLRDAGYRVESETRSLRVYDKAKETQPDLVLLDIMMPFLDGWDELKLFSLDDELRRLPVIVVTADRDAFKGIDAKKYGVIDQVFKPFELNDLLQRVERALASMEQRSLSSS
ncbi:MAG TPA: response regulator [Chloroflexota bacterium]|nr:response regulator [Chloroflexota bacterium]